MKTVNTKTIRQRHPMWIFPATYTYYDLIDEGEFQFQQVEWTDDFGIFKKGEHVAYIGVDFEKGIIKEWDDDGHMMRAMLFLATPNGVYQS